MTSLYNLKEIPGWHKPETRVNCPCELRDKLRLKKNRIRKQKLKEKFVKKTEKFINEFEKIERSIKTVFSSNVCVKVELVKE